MTPHVAAQVAALCREPQPEKEGLAMATAHAPGRPPVSGPLPPDSSREGARHAERRARAGDDPKECKRLAEVDFPDSSSRSATRRASTGTR
jgi:hypothetical protein